MSRTCALASGDHTYVSRDGEKKATLEFCTQILREKATGDYALNPYVYAEVFYRGDSGAWVPENEVESNVMSITAEVRHQLADDATQLTAGGTTSVHPRHNEMTASAGYPFPHTVIHPTDTDPYVITYEGSTTGGYDGTMESENEVHFPGLDGELPEQHVRLP